MRITRSVTLILFCISLPLFLLLTNLRVLSTNYSVYEFAFERYGIEKNSGLDKQQLNIVGTSIIDYFQNARSSELLDVKLQKDGVEYSLFSEREILHMYDVLLNHYILARSLYVPYLYLTTHILHCIEYSLFYSVQGLCYR